MNLSPKWLGPVLARFYPAGAVVSALLAGAPSATGQILDSNGIEIGGSNFVTYSVGTRATGDFSVWYQPTFLRPVIGTLHYDADRVRADLAIMKGRGQHKVTLVIWHQHLANVGYDGVYGHIVASDSGNLLPQQQDKPAARAPVHLRARFQRSRHPVRTPGR